MLTYVARFLLASTSLSPVLLVVAIGEFEAGLGWRVWLPWLVSCFALGALCHIILHTAEYYAECPPPIVIESIGNRDYDMVTFLFIYLLPLVRLEDATLFTSWTTGIAVFLLIVLSIVHARAYSFNPLMGLVFRYRFYSARTVDRISCLLISKTDVSESDKVHVVRLARDVYLRTN